MDNNRRPVSVESLKQGLEIGRSQIGPIVIGEEANSGSTPIGERPLRFISGRCDIGKRKTSKIGEDPGVPAYDVATILVDTPSHLHRLSQSSNSGTG